MLTQALSVESRLLPKGCVECTRCVGTVLARGDADEVLCLRLRRTEECAQVLTYICMAQFLRLKQPMNAPSRKTVAAKPKPRKRSKKSATDIAISTELAPAVAIALLDKSSKAPGSAPPALEVLAAGVTASDTEGNVRVQLMFPNGAVLPVEMSADAGAALSKGLDEELPDKK